MEWTDKRDGIDDIVAADINTVAHGVQANETAIAGKQDALEFDEVPIENSQNPVKSGGVYEVSANKVAIFTEEPDLDPTSYKIGDIFILDNGVFILTGMTREEYTTQYQLAKIDTDIFRGSEAPPVSGESAYIKFNVGDLYEYNGTIYICVGKTGGIIHPTLTWQKLNSVQPDWNQNNSSADDFIKNKPVIDNSPSSGSDNLVKSGGVYSALSAKEDALEDVTVSASSATFDFSNRGNDWVHYSSDSFAVLEIDIPSGVYSYNFKARASFNSPSTLPTSVIYAASSELINWTGTDCYNFETRSVFRPQMGKHYDVDFYFNGSQFVGKVFGYVPANMQQPDYQFAGGVVPTMTFTNCLDSTSMRTLEIRGAAGGVGNPGTLLNPDRTAASKLTGNESTKRVLDTSKYYLGLSPNNATNETHYNNSAVLIDGANITVTGYYTSSYNGYGAAFPVACEPSTTYTVKWSSSTRTYARWATYASDGTFTAGDVLHVGKNYDSKFGTLTTPATAAMLVLFLIPRGDTNNAYATGTFENIMLVEGEYTSATMPAFVPFGKFGIPFTVTGSSGTREALIMLDSPLGYQVTVDLLTIEYDKRKATLRIDTGTYITTDVTSQINWNTLPNTDDPESTTITVTSEVLPSDMIAYYYVEN